MRRIFFFVAANLFFSLGLIAQSQFTLYQLNSQLPQANMVNAGLFPDYKLTIGIPALSSTYITNDFGSVSFNRAFSRTANDSLHFDPAQMASYLNENNRIDINANAQLIYLALRTDKNFFSLSLNERVDFGIRYPKSLVKLIGSGNGENIGELVAFNNLGVRGQVFHELAMGYGREINDKLSIGIRAKLLSGIVSLDVNNINAALLTTTDSLYLYTPEFNINTTGLDLITGDGDIFKAATAFNNIGFAVDLGANYWLTDKLNISLSINDLGGISWKNDTRQFQFDEVKYSFTGIDFIAAIDNNNNSNLFQQELDSLKGLYSPDTVDGISYKTKLASKFYAGGSYKVGKHHTFGAMFYGDVFKGNFKPAFGLSYNLELGKIWTIGVNGSFRNNSVNNLGIGTTLTLGAFQIYALTENATAFAKFSDARFIDARVGMNLVFGKMNKDKKLKRESTKVVKSSPSLLSEQVKIATAGTAKDELSPGFYTIIASFSTKEEAEEYGNQLHYEGYAARTGYQSERGQYYTYLMYSKNDGNKAIEKKNTLKNSFAPGLERPWVLWVKKNPK
jgi:Family of unknown function (DUF5723)